MLFYAIWIAAVFILGWIIDAAFAIEVGMGITHEHVLNDFFSLLEWVVPLALLASFIWRARKGAVPFFSAIIAGILTTDFFIAMCAIGTIISAV